MGLKCGGQIDKLYDARSRYTRKNKRIMVVESREWKDKEEARIDKKNATKEFEEYQAKRKKEFAEERGGWFFGQIQLAYNERYAPARDFGPHSVDTPANHAAQDDLEYKPNA